MALVADSSGSQPQWQETDYGDDDTAGSDDEKEKKKEKKQKEKKKKKEKKKDDDEEEDEGEKGEEEEEEEVPGSPQAASSPMASSLSSLMMAVPTPPPTPAPTPAPAPAPRPPATAAARPPASASVPTAAAKKARPAPPSVAVVEEKKAVPPPPPRLATTTKPATAAAPPAAAGAPAIAAAAEGGGGGGGGERKEGVVAVAAVAADPPFIEPGEAICPTIAIREIAGVKWFENVDPARLYVINSNQDDPIDLAAPAETEGKEGKGERKGGSGAAAAAAAKKAKEKKAKDRTFINIKSHQQASSWNGAMYMTPIMLVKQATLQYGNYDEWNPPGTPYCTSNLLEAHVTILFHADLRAYVGEYAKFKEDVRKFILFRRAVQHRFHHDVVANNVGSYEGEIAERLRMERHTNATANHKMAVAQLRNLKSIGEDERQKEIEAADDLLAAELRKGATTQEIAEELRRVNGRGFIHIPGVKGATDGDEYLDGGDGYEGAYMSFEAPLFRNLTAREIKQLDGREPKAEPNNAPANVAIKKGRMSKKKPVFKQWITPSWHDMAAHGNTEDSKDDNIPWMERVLDPDAQVALLVRLQCKESDSHLSIRCGDTMVTINHYKPGHCVAGAGGMMFGTGAPPVHRPVLGAERAISLLAQTGKSWKDAKHEFAQKLLALAEAIHSGPDRSEEEDKHGDGGGGGGGRGGGGGGRNNNNNNDRGVVVRGGGGGGGGSGGGGGGNKSHRGEDREERGGGHQKRAMISNGRSSS